MAHICVPSVNIKLNLGDGSGQDSNHLAQQRMIRAPIRLNLKYLYFVSRQGVSLGPGTDVSSEILSFAEAHFLRRRH